MNRFSLLLLVSLICLFLSDLNAQPCTTPPELKQEIYVFPYEVKVEFTFDLWGVIQIIQDGESFDDNPKQISLQRFVFFQDLKPNTTYHWRARYACPNDTFSDWSVVYTFTTPPPCPLAPEIKLDSAFTIDFPAPVSPVIGYSNCNKRTDGKAHVYRFIVPADGSYRLNVLNSDTNKVNTGAFEYSSNYCRGNPECVSVSSFQGERFTFYGRSAGRTITLAFTTNPDVLVAHRTFKITYEPCPPPTNLELEEIKADSVKLHFSGGIAGDEIEILPDSKSYTGVPNITNINYRATIKNLESGTDYHWRARSNCEVNVSDWVEGVGFSTNYICDSIPLLKCDSTYTSGFKAGLNRVKKWRYTAPYSGNLSLITTPLDTSTSVFYSGYFAAWIDSTKNPCNQYDIPPESWPNGNLGYYKQDTLNFGYFIRGKTYEFHMDKRNEKAMPLAFRWNCLDACPAPGLLTVQAFSFDSVRLSWHNFELKEKCEIEITEDPVNFTGITPYSSISDYLEIGGLKAKTRYYWRVRSYCSGIGYGPWSEISNFLTAPDCNNAYKVKCDDQNYASTSDDLPVLNCQDGIERFYQFVPQFSGKYELSTYNLGPSSLLLCKPGANCKLDTSWICIPLEDQNTDKSFNLGILTAGVPALFGFDFKGPFTNHPEYPNVGFKINCPSACLPPENLVSKIVNNHDALLKWKANFNQVSWDLQVKRTDQDFYYYISDSTDTDSILFADLKAGRHYKWRVRGNCGVWGSSQYSETSYFDISPDCQQWPLLSCDQEITLHFPQGIGFWQNLPACDQVPKGTELILQFKTVDSTAYFQFRPKDVPHAIYLKDADAYSCADSSGWICIKDTHDVYLISLEHLRPGGNYYLMLKKWETYGEDSITLSYYCESPCKSTKYLSSEIFGNGHEVVLHWDGNKGDWRYQLGLSSKTTIEKLSAPVKWDAGYGGSYLSNLFTLRTNDLYAWRIRSLCPNGDTSEWSKPDRFQLLYCQNTLDLPCNDTITPQYPQQTPYTIYDVCSESTRKTWQVLYHFTVNAPGNYVMRLTNTKGVRARFNRSNDVTSSCGTPTNWTQCFYINSDTVIYLNNLNPGDFLINFTTIGNVPFTPLIETYCLCQPASNVQGILYSNGTAGITWQTVDQAKGADIELIPENQAFTGSPNYFTDLDTATITGLNPETTYKFRLRPHCGTLQTNVWSDSGLIHLLVYCDSIPNLKCGQKIVFQGGTGNHDFMPCGYSAPGKEVFFRVTPEFTAKYRLSLGPLGPTAYEFKVSSLTQCEGPGGILKCLPQTDYDAIIDLNYLTIGKSLLFMADQLNTTNTQYRISVGCDVENEEASDIWASNSYRLSINDSCKIFTNQFANSNIKEPDPSEMPGNWKDGPKHNVWFGFYAPASGTVQVNVNSVASKPFDPHVALLEFAFDSINFSYPYQILATGEDNAGPNPNDAVLYYTGLTPGVFYYLMVDGANGTTGHFCISIKDHPDIPIILDSCQSFVQTNTGFTAPGAWRNLYASESAHVTGTLIGAIKTEENLGKIQVSSGILPAAPVLPGGQKLLPRYFRIEPEYQPVNPVTVRLFFSKADLEAYNLTPPVDVTLPSELGLTHYDGLNEDCDPENNGLSAGLSVNQSMSMILGNDSLFYLEAIFDHFSEFGAALAPLVKTQEAPPAKSALWLWPNPASNTVKAQIGNVSDANSLQFVLYNMMAIPVRYGGFNPNLSNAEAEIDIAGLNSGAYQLCVFQNGHLLGKVVVLKID